jgi:hypothetical protein
MGDHACRHAYGGRSIWNVVYHDGIRSNPRVAPYRDGPQYFSSRTNVDMTTDSRYAAVVSTQCYLLEQQTIWPDLSFRMDDDAVRMRQQQPTAEFAIERNVGPGDYAPTSVSQHCANSRQ